MRTGLLKAVVILIALVLVLVINSATSSGTGAGFLWPILSIGFVGFLIAVIKWKPNKDKKNDDSSEDDKFILKRD